MRETEGRKEKGEKGPHIIWNKERVWILQVNDSIPRIQLSPDRVESNVYSTCLIVHVGGQEKMEDLVINHKKGKSS